MGKREQSPFLDDQGKEVLNFQITLLIAFAVSAVLMLVFVGFILASALGVFDLVITVIAAIKANDGIRYRYPFSLKLIK